MVLLARGGSADAGRFLIALVAGGTGLVGGHLLRRLAADSRYHEVRALVRRALPPDPALARVRALRVDWDRLADHAGDLAADHVYSALGTTIADAGSRERFRQVDHDYVAALARLTRAAGARHFSLVSAIGADPGSRIFYNRVKGEVEATVRAAGFPSGAILRPSMLGGDRAAARPLERLGQRIAALLPGRLRLVRADDVARVMIATAVREEPGWRVLESEEIRRQARTDTTRTPE